ncbi:probable ATP-dependent RNA helicase spindle-E isoform X2 [Bicyclus anynana]|uniref:Probable ATP-dependent RNA helicase spindle-E n=1 Tax=Bicyclus anynana TaxID=110368 RepID=A0ABM3LYD6_BICAN|nr:probable ATP-dependent RNA helicase spindle-E isoform X2 [Bicyclus anynana]
MDEVYSFFRSTQPTPVVKLPTPQTGGHRITKEDTLNQLDRRENHRKSVVMTGTDYAKVIKEQELKRYLECEVERQMSNSLAGGLNSMEQLSIRDSVLSINQIQSLTEEAMTEVYSKYSFQRKEDTGKLAIYNFHEEILKRIQTFPITIIEGPTGCGKTTQVPQWILDDAYNNRRPCKIVVTQPRKIAAISIAKRVAQERGWDVGGVVGYQVGLENKTTTDTRISYVTTGVLLQKLVNAKNTDEYTHIVLDEVHEREQDMDFLLLVVRKLLFTATRTVKVILMSATFNTQIFQDYFTLPTPSMGLQSSGCFKITNDKPTFSVKLFYLDHIAKMGYSNLQQNMRELQDPEIHPDMNNLVSTLIEKFEQIDMKEEFVDIDRAEADVPSVLIFLPGIYEIEELYAVLTDSDFKVKYNWWVLPLHSTITADEQVRVFQRAPPGHRKIILATNIAESSITVPDIKYVIDYCLMKRLVVDPNTSFTSLQLCWASKTNCEQRSGRAGRVRDGRVYRLIYQKFYVTLPQDATPEMVRCPLERLVLLAKMLDMGPPADILALAMDPPDMSNILRTILVLKEVGALKKTVDDDWSAVDGDITYMGRIMAKLPLDVKSSKLIVLGYIFGCLEESIVMAAGMSVKNIFSSPFRERLNAYNSKLTWADGSMSDCIAMLNVYKVWDHLRKQNHFKQPAGTNEAQWARRFYVQIRALRELNDLVRELRMRLSREGIDPKKGTSPWSKAEHSLALKVILAGAFYPHYFVHGSSDEARERDAVRVLGGLDPRNTVYLRGFPDNQPGEVYAKVIKKKVRDQIGDEPRVTFDKNSRKVYLTFQDNQNVKSDQKGGDPTIPGQVVLPVYKAIKARHLKMEIRIPLLSVEKANLLAEGLAEMKKNANIDKMVPRLPEIDDTHFPLQISQLVNVGRFWVQYADDSTASELRLIQGMLNRKSMFAYTDDVTEDALVAAPYVDATGSMMYRARVTRLLPKNMMEVFYVDYGTMGRVSSSSLQELPRECREIPPLAMQCVLSNIAPSPLLNEHGQWSAKALKLFTDLVSKGRLLGKIYSVAHGIVSIELLADGGKINVNKELLDNGLAVASEESYDSKLNHDLRQMATELNMTQKRAYNKEQTDLAFNQMHECEAPNFKECFYDACLKGPDSPLESTLHNLMYSSRNKQVTVEWNSINSVLLDTEPQEKYERLLVSAEVGQNDTGSRLTLRHTTLLPNIRGLPSIIALLFSPQAELRRDPTMSRYVSALCGLGSAGDMPLFPEHDILINIYAELTIDDLGLVGLLLLL